MIRVAIADDQVLLRRSLVSLIANEPDLELVGEASTGSEAIDVARSTEPDVMLMDIRMPQLDGLAATRQICSIPDLRQTRVLVLSMFDLEEYVYEALLAGASGFLLKDTTPEQLLEAVRRVADGEAILAPALTRRLIEHFVQRPSTSSPIAASITARETEVLTLVGMGFKNAEIAERLFIGTATVKTHISRLLLKLDVRDRVQLVIAAYELGLVSVR